MADSLRKLIMGNVKTTLQGITVAGGYNRTFRTVERAKVFPTNPEWDVVCFSSVTESKTQRENLITNVELIIAVGFWLRVDDPALLEETIDDAAYDIEKILLVDRKRGTYAEDTFIAGVRDQQGFEEQSVGGAVVEVHIHYRHMWGDPGQAVGA